MKPARYFLLSVLLFTLVLFSMGCGTASPEAGPTAESQVVVEAPALPTATIASTSTPAPTATPSPTPIPPTATLEPTATSRPTQTPRPTATPEPTETPTAVPPTLVPPTAPPPLPTATSTPSVDTGQLLRDQIVEAIAEINNYRNALYHGVWTGANVGTFAGSVDCAVSVQSYERMVGSINLDVSGSDPTVQNAYAVARSAIDEFIAIAQPWVDGCRQSLAEGVPEKSLPNVQRDTTITTLRAPEDMLNQAYRILDQ